MDKGRSTNMSGGRSYEWKSRLEGRGSEDRRKELKGAIEIRVE
jgi:hypothetical protein